MCLYGEKVGYFLKFGSSQKKNAHVSKKNEQNCSFKIMVTKIDLKNYYHYIL